MDKIVLYQFPRPEWGIANESPFCLKVETYLRMTAIPYQLVEMVDPKQSPNGKLPYMSFNGDIHTDSGCMIDFLEKQYGKPMTKTLTARQQTETVLVQRTLEEHMYWAVVHSRFIDPKGVQSFCGPYMKKIAFPFNYLLRRRLQKGVKKALWYQGLGRHDLNTMYALCLADLKAVRVLLDDKPFYFGETPSLVDACIYANLSVILYQPWDNVLREYLNEQSVIEQYCERMTSRFFPELVT